MSREMARSVRYSARRAVLGSALRQPDRRATPQRWRIFRPPGRVREWL